MSHKQKKMDIANKFLYICPEREKKKIQSADFHTYANIQKAMCIKNPATEGGKDILWRIYKKNRFRELFLVGTDKKSEVPDTIKQSHTIK